MKSLRIIVSLILVTVALPAIALPQDPASDEVIRKKKLASEYQKVEEAYQDALRKYTPKHPEVIRLKKELDQFSQPQAGPLFKQGTVSPLASLQATVKGTFWRNPEWVKTLDLSADQQKKMDEMFQQYRLKLIDLNAALEKEEIVMEPLLANGRPAPEAEAKINSQIDRIASARAELEKANSRMLMSVLQVLTPEQWDKLPMPVRKPLLSPKPIGKE